jgi:hypothetical protein
MYCRILSKIQVKTLKVNFVLITEHATMFADYARDTMDVQLL